MISSLSAPLLRRLIVWFWLSDFAVKDLGKLYYFLGLEVTYPQDGLALSQQKFSLDIVGVQGCYYSHVLH
jgi:hypothetical protein